MFGDLPRTEAQVYSQNGEDGVIRAIFDRIGTTNKFFVEFGCGDAVECNTAYLLELGWRGLMMEGAQECLNPLAKVHSHFITAENINALFAQHNVPETFDLLSIDIDGNDLWVWQAIQYRPRVVVIEYNGQLGPHARLSVPYDPNFVWDCTNYYGASLQALAELGRRKGYELVYCAYSGVNAFFVHRDLLPRGYRPPPVEQLYRPLFYSHTVDRSREMIDPFAGDTTTGNLLVGR